LQMPFPLFADSAFLEESRAANSDMPWSIPFSDLAEENPQPNNLPNPTSATEDLTLFSDSKVMSPLGFDDLSTSPFVLEASPTWLTQSESKDSEFPFDLELEGDPFFELSEQLPSRRQGAPPSPQSMPASSRSSSYDPNQHPPLF
jgi:hypothetical protein